MAGGSAGHGGSERRVLAIEAPVDQQSVDWARARRIVVRVRLHYRYTYTSPVADLKQRLIVVPPDESGDQRLIAHRLAVHGASGGPGVAWEQDAFGNRIARIAAPAVQRAIAFEADYQVERERDRGPLWLPVGPAGDRLIDVYRAPTALTAADARLREIARELAAGTRCARTIAERAFDWAAGSIAYQIGATDVTTPAAAALARGRGVCQDYAHILIAVLRENGIPARYVSGQLLGEGAPHAWVEALIADPERPGGLTALAHDPANRRPAGFGYITVATGRDFADVSPTSGTFHGAAIGRLSADKRAEIVEIDYLDGARTDEAAA